MGRGDAGLRSLAKILRAQRPKAAHRALVAPLSPDLPHRPARSAGQQRGLRPAGGGRAPSVATRSAGATGLPAHCRSISEQRSVVLYGFSSFCGQPGGGAGVGPGGQLPPAGLLHLQHAGALRGGAPALSVSQAAAHPHLRGALAGAARKRVRQLPKNQRFAALRRGGLQPGQHLPLLPGGGGGGLRGRKVPGFRHPHRDFY